MGGTAGTNNLCTPVVVTDTVGLGAVPQNGFTTDGTNIFWTDILMNSGGMPVWYQRLARVPVGGGVAVTMAYVDATASSCGGATNLTAIAVDGTNVYFVAGGVLWKIPKDSGPAPATGGNSIATTNGPCMLFGAVSPLAGSTSGSYHDSNLAADGTNVYACGSANGPLEKVPVSGAPASVLTTTRVQSDALATDGTNVYYWDAAGDLLSVSALVDGAAPITLAPLNSTDRSYTLVAIGGFLYWSDVNTKSIQKISTAGGAPPVVLASGNPQAQNVQYIAVDGTNVYWFDGNGTITKVSVNGGTPVPIVTMSTIGKGGSRLGPITVDATSVYWFDLPHIYKCPK